MESYKHSQCHEEDRSLKERLDQIAESLRKLPPDRLKQVEKLLKSFDKKALSLKEDVQRIGVSVDTVRRAVKSGKLGAFQLNEGGVYRISMEELDRLMANKTYSQ